MVGFPQGALEVDPVLADEVRSWTGGDGGWSRPVVEGAGGGRRRLVGADATPGPVGRPRLEADQADALGPLALLVARPTLVVGAHRFESPVALTWQARLLPYARRLVASAAAVGRVEVVSARAGAGSDGGSVALGSLLLGTASLLAAEVAVTTAPVARGVDDVLRSGGSVRVAFGSTRLWPGAWAEVLAVAPAPPPPDDGLGVLTIRLHAAHDGSRPDPLALLDEDPRPDGWVALVGCAPEPDAADHAHPVLAPKLLAPGARVGPAGHDCTVAAGSEGAALVDVATGALLGVHLGPATGAAAGAAAAGATGSLARARSVLGAVRFAAPQAEITLQLREPASPVEVGGTPLPARSAADAPAPPGSPATRLLEADRPTAAALAGRPGYDAGFLGDGDRQVSLPGISDDVAEQLVTVDAAAAGPQRFALPYEHFSVVLHAGRRFALFVAGNIDGGAAQAIKRHGDPWARDPRLARETQWGDDLYAGNDLDRGHLVRRLDPAWGATAAQGETDTFYFTNSCPQFHRFNDGIWGDLEDYLLQHASTLGFRATVFTGPVFADDDPTYREARIPLRFWKVAVMVDADRNRLSATGYLLDQTGMGASFDFVFGEFGMSQVPLSRLEALTRLDWGALRPFDPLDATGDARPLGELAQIVL